MRNQKFYNFAAHAAFTLAAILPIVALTACDDDDDDVEAVDYVLDDIAYDEATEATATSANYYYVDLGLESGLLWATRNVGAASAEDGGSYLAWGEITEASSYTAARYDSLYVIYNDENYYVSSITGDTIYSSGYVTSFGDSISTFSDYDAATAERGGSWRTPTKTEMTELTTSCTWTWCESNGVTGYKVEGTNGASIFLPAAGWKDDETTTGEDAGETDNVSGRYWCSNGAGYTYPYVVASSLIFTESGNSVATRPCYIGRSIRPVCDPE